MKRNTILFFILALGTILYAGNTLNIGQYQVLPNTDFVIQLEVENSDAFVAFQVDIPIPNGFKYVAGSAALNVSRISGHALSASLINGNILRLIAYSVSNIPFIGNSGSLVSFSLKSGTVPATFALLLNQPMLGDNQTTNILTGSSNGSVTVLAPNITLSTATLDYGRVPLQTSVDRTFVITNAGSANLTISGLNFNDSQFTTTSPASFTVAPNSNRSITVKFSPASKGTLIKQLQISSNDPDQPIVIVSLNAVAFAVNEIHTGNITGASSTTKTLEFTLNNMENFTGFQFDLNLPQPITYKIGTTQLFRVQDQTVSVNQINNQTLRVVCFSAGSKNFTGVNGKVLSLDFLLNGIAGYYNIGISNVIVANTSGENIVSASFCGQLYVTSSDIHADSQLSFGDVSILSNKILQHRIYNYGQETLIINQLTFSNENFKSNQVLPVTIPPNAYFDLPIEFKKSTKGSITATLRVFSNDPDENPYSIQLSGNAFIPNYFKISNQIFTQGETKLLPIVVENEEPFVALQFDLSHPLEFIPDLNAIILTERKQDHVFAATKLSNTSLRIIVYSPGQKSFTGNSGAVINIPFKAEVSLLPGNYSLNLSNTLMSNAKSENVLYSSTNAQLKILRLNHLPVANAGTDQTVDENTLVMLDGSASSDPDNDNLTFKWMPPLGITLSAANVAKPTFIAPTVTKNAVFKFSLVINDGFVDSSADSVNILVISHTRIDANNYPDIQIYPNPAKDYFKVAGLIEIDILRLYDISGNLLFVTDKINNSIPIELLPKGLYFVELTTKYGLIIRKLAH